MFCSVPLSRHCLALLVLCIPLLCRSQSPLPPFAQWQSLGTIVPRGADSAWDGSSGCIIGGLTKRDSTYYLYYLRGFRGCWEAERKGSHTSVGLATSRDGIRWTPSGTNPVMRPHDFKTITLHKEGIRHAAILYVPALKKFIAYLGVGHYEGVARGECTYRADTSQCGCNEQIDEFVYYAESPDGVHWSAGARVQGAYERSGDETTARAALYHQGWYYVWSQKGRGGKSIFVSKGRDPLKLTPLGLVYSFDGADTPNELNDVFLHEDGKTISLLAKSDKGWHEGGLCLGISSLKKPTQHGQWQEFFPKSESVWHGKVLRDEQRWIMVMMHNDLADIVGFTASVGR